MKRSLTTKIANRLRHWRKLGLREGWRDALARLDKTDRVQFGLRGGLVRFRVRHRSGPQHIDAPADEPIVLCTVRDGLPWLRSFLAHHRAMGFRHFVVLDNGSTDGTIEALEAEAGVTLLTSKAPYRAYENTFKRYLCDRYGRDRWCLFVDIDEQFDFPLSDRRSLGEFVAYLEAHDYTAVVTQMLDLYSDRPLAECSIEQEPALGALFPLCDIESIRKERYPFAAIDPIAMHFGGVRKGLFGTDNGLTKISFFKNVAGLEPFHQWHHVKGGRIADVSAVLYHYPFIDSFAEKVAEAAASGRYGYGTTDEYVAYNRALSDGTLAISSPTGQRLDRTDLIESGFLIVPDRYREFGETRG